MAKELLSLFSRRCSIVVPSRGDEILALDVPTIVALFWKRCQIVIGPDLVVSIVVLIIERNF